MATSENAAPMLSYDGRVGELYRIFLINLLLTIVTLGIWRFWAITRMRRYIWSRTALDGDRLEYDGTGGQLFVGFLLALVMLAALFGVAAVLGSFLADINIYLGAVPLLLAELTLITLALGARFSAQRYRLGHTIWRGVRGGMQGSMIAYGIRSLLYSLASVVTLGQLLPWAMLRMLERRINASSFGTLRFVSHSRAMPLYLRFLAAFVSILALAAVVLGIVYLLERPLIAMYGHPADQAAMQAQMQSAVVVLIGAWLVIVFGGALISAGFEAAFIRQIVGHTQLGEVQFSSHVSGMDVLKLRLGNVLILVFTLGLGLPFILQRNACFFAVNLLVSGKLDPATLVQSDLPVSRFGEGMFQVLDAGAGII